MKILIALPFALPGVLGFLIGMGLVRLSWDLHEKKKNEGMFTKAVRFVLGWVALVIGWPVYVVGVHALMISDKIQGR